jgi:hypothetical protein
MMDRLNIVPFLNTIPPERRNKDILRVLTEDEDELTVALAWVIQGYFDSKKHGNQKPDSVNTAKEGYERDVNPLSVFVREEIVFDDGTVVGEMHHITRTENSELFNRYKELSSQEEVKAVKGAKGFAHWFGKMAPYYAERVGVKIKKVHTAAGLAWDNVRLREESDFESEPEEKKGSSTADAPIDISNWSLEDYNKYLESAGFLIAQEIVPEPMPEPELEEITEKAYPIVDQATFVEYMYKILQDTKVAGLKGLAPSVLKDATCNQIKAEHPEFSYWDVEGAYDLMVERDPAVQALIIDICGRAIG